MVFQPDDDGPFWLSEEQRRELKHPVQTGGRKTREKKIDELLTDLKNKIPGFQLTRRLRKKELQDLATKNDISLKIEEDVVRPGWVNEPKGLLQVLWERGWIDEANYSSYKVQYNKDDDFSLQRLMSKCPDFAEEKSAMEYLLERISAHNEFNATILVTPKYHCELAGEGIEYSWGLAKRFFRKLLVRKKGRVNFHDSVRECLSYVKVDHVRKFAAKTRRYMLTYAFCAELPEVKCHHAGETLSYATIAKYVKTEFKTHRSASDQDTGFLARIHRESIGCKDK